MIKNDITAAILSAVLINRQGKPDVADDGKVRNAAAEYINPDEQWRRYLDIITLNTAQELADYIRENGIPTTPIKPLIVRLDPHPEYAKELESPADIGEYITSLLPKYIDVRVVSVYESGSSYINVEFSINTNGNAQHKLENDLVEYAKHVEQQQFNHKLDIIMKMLGEVMANQKVGKDKNVSSAS